MNLTQLGKQIARSALANCLYFSGALRLLQLRPPSWRILMYHRITTPELCGYALQPGMYVSPENFQQQMLFLKKHANVIALDELVEMLGMETEPPKSTVAITFDDGWQDNYQFAFPALKQHNLPATIFLATALIGTDDTLWSDKIPRSLHAARENPQLREKLLAAVDDQRFVASGKLRTLLLAEEYAFVSQLDQFINEIKSMAKHQALADWLGRFLIEHGGVPPQRAFLSWEEVREMAESRISFGSHTHSHVPLAHCSTEAMQRELSTSFEEFKQHSITPSGVFCYPEGAYSEHSQQTLREFEISFALSIEKTAQLNEKPALLNRIGVHQDISASNAQFGARIWANSLF